MPKQAGNAKIVIEMQNFWKMPKYGVNPEIMNKTPDAWINVRNQGKHQKMWTKCQKYSRKIKIMLKYG